MGQNYENKPYLPKNVIFNGNQNEKSYSIINKIKSLVILKKILSHLQTRKKFALIRYNKQINNLLGYDIQDYSLFIMF